MDDVREKVSQEKVGASRGRTKRKRQRKETKQERGKLGGETCRLKQKSAIDEMRKRNEKRVAC